VAAAAARMRVGLLESARSRLAELVDAARGRAAAGDTAEYDAERVALELDLLDDELTGARRDLAKARIALGGLLGTPEVPIDAGDDLALPTVRDAGEVVRADVTAAERRADAARVEVRHARRGWFPRLELGVGVQFSGVEALDGVGYFVLVGGELPLFDRGGAAARKAAAAAAMWDAEAAALSAEASAGVRAAREDLASVVAQAATFRDGAAGRASTLITGAEVAYREGDRSIVELLDALRTSRTAQVRIVELMREARDAELTLWLEEGRVP
jgi:cobalt-zinc-cadmium efflux system outer membrane protein